MYDFINNLGPIVLFLAVSGCCINDRIQSTNLKKAKVEACKTIKDQDKKINCIKEI